MTDTSTSTIASFHLIRYDSARAMRHMAFDRPLLRSAGGLLFWRLLGTGRGRAMSLGADLRRWALFAVWRGEDDLDAFLRDSPIADRWRSEASEFWQVRLAPTASRGAWSGRDPFHAPATRDTGDTRRGAEAGAAPPGGGPVAVLTRASIRPRRLVAFYRSVPPVDELLRRQDGCLASIGVGEWPLARQATFSLWRDREAVRAFAYRGEAHRRVIERVRSDDWYAEELFARFTPYAAEGTWDGADPLR
ncbi:spheroidene monooxygenase [Nonomuraea sp. CA-218870]|uniref:spheroidene monooxygenase n=1 Tax=Nonomuraea sp. CA-218870 TaxID=3239998 RepID=UPI003D8C7418